jgi:uncharacterized membrane protein
MVTNYCVKAIWVLMAMFSAPAMAWVQICNGRGENSTTAVALGAMDRPGVSTGGHTGVTVEGWWTLSPGECATVSTANANQNWLYFHAHGRGGTLQGDARLCVRSKPFTSRQQFLSRDETCTGGWKEAGFSRRQSSAKNYKFTIK